MRFLGWFILVIIMSIVAMVTYPFVWFSLHWSLYEWFDCVTCWIPDAASMTQDKTYGDYPEKRVEDEDDATTL